MHNLLIQVKKSILRVFTGRFYLMISSLNYFKLEIYLIYKCNFLQQGCHMVRKSQEKQGKMTKVKKSQVKMGVFEKIQEKTVKKHQLLSAQIYKISYF